MLDRHHYSTTPATTARDLVSALGGRWHGTYGMAPCPVHKDRTPSLKISDGAKGLIVHCFAGCHWRDVKDTLSNLGHRTRTFAGKSHNEVIDFATERTARRANAIWKASRELKATLGATYLKARALTPEAFPATLRFHASLPHPAGGEVHPALVAAVTVWPSREVRAIHRTYLQYHGRAKIPGGQAKCMLGPCKGGAVRLAAPGPRLMVAEGLETALSVWIATGIPTWAALSAGGIRNLILPALPLASEVIIAADADAVGAEAARVAAETWTREGRRVRIAIPTANHKDFNDVLKPSTGE